MHRRILLILIILLLGLNTSALGIDTSKTTNISILVQNVFSMEFYTDEKVIYRDTVPFTNIDPNKSIVYPDSRAENDGKSDIGIVCKSNLGDTWYLKIHAITTAPLTPEKLKYYVSQPWNRNTGGTSDGSLTRSADWYPFANTATAIYSSGFNDTSNLPFGTLITFNISLNPSGLKAGQGYSAAIVYTFTTTP